MKPKLLILPSWYISGNDRINGSFFQAQGKLVSEAFDTRVIFSKSSRRPSIKKSILNPLASWKEWRDFLRRQDGRVTLPDEDVFNEPELYLFENKDYSAPWRTATEAALQHWTYRISTMIKDGWRPDLIRAHSAFPAGVVAQRIKSRFAIPYVITEHMPFSIHKFPKYLQPEIKKGFECADLVLSLSYDKVRQLAMSGIDVEPNIIFNLLDEELFSSHSSGYTAGQKLQLVTIGAASFYKDHKTLLRSVRLLVDYGVPFHLTMIGLKVWGGDKLSETLTLIDDLELSEHVTVIDKLGRHEIAAALPKYHVYLMTSIQEGFPNSVLEALASGLFVVATRHGGSEDLIDDEIGRVTSIKNPEAIADLLHRIYRGDIEFSPHHIRNKTIGICGRDAYKERLLNHLFEVLK
jgi:glycosyltransferase involved in cell wall biosynthesis